MMNRKGFRLTALWCFALGASIVLALTVGFARPPAPANASMPSALELADRALSSSSLLADESPYELIDPVGPGGATEDQAKGEVLSSTMIGGIYNDNSHYGSTYFDGLFDQSVQQDYSHRGFAGTYRASPQQWGGRPR
jgi:hypothetical protein